MPGRGPNGKPQARISVLTHDGTLLTIFSVEFSISVDHEFQDVTTRNSVSKTYLVDKGTFTIKGKL